ncbi:MAG: hypothetical protein WBQ73_01020 [Candidatus Babeliales bacterium]
MDRLNTIMRLVLLLTLCFGTTTFPLWKTTRSFVNPFKGFMDLLTKRLQKIPSMRTLQSDQSMMWPLLHPKAPGQQTSLNRPILLEGYRPSFPPVYTSNPYQGQLVEENDTGGVSSFPKKVLPLRHPYIGWTVWNNGNVKEKKTPKKVLHPLMHMWIGQRLIDLIPKEQLDKVVEFNNQCLWLYLDAAEKAVGEKVGWSFVEKRKDWFITASTLVSHLKDASTAIPRDNTILLHKDSYSSQQVIEALMDSLQLSLNGLWRISFGLKYYHEGITRQLSQLFTDIDRLEEYSRPGLSASDFVERLRSPEDAILDDAILVVEKALYLSKEQRESLKKKIINTLYVQSDTKKEEPLLFKFMKHDMAKEISLLEEKLENVRKDLYDNRQKTTEEIASDLDAIITQLPEILTGTIEFYNQTQERFIEITQLLSQAGYLTKYTIKTSYAHRKLTEELEKLSNELKEQWDRGE